VGQINENNRRRLVIFNLPTAGTIQAKENKTQNFNSSGGCVDGVSAGFPGQGDEG